MREYREITKYQSTYQYTAGLYRRKERNGRNAIYTKQLSININSHPALDDAHQYPHKGRH